MKTFQPRNSTKAGTSPLATDLATLTRSVLIQYGVGGTVGQVTQGYLPHQWEIEVLGGAGHPSMTLKLMCSDRTPPHSLRSAIAMQLDI
jgi:hypothetical protein